MSLLGIILVVVLILLLFGAFPRAGAYNAGWGHAPVGILGIVLIIVIVLALTGHLGAAL